MAAPEGAPAKLRATYSGRLLCRAAPPTHLAQRRSRIYFQFIPLTLRSRKIDLLLLQPVNPATR